ADRPGRPGSARHADGASWGPGHAEGAGLAAEAHGAERPELSLRPGGQSGLTDIDHDDDVIRTAGPERQADQARHCQQPLVHCRLASRGSMEDCPPQLLSEANAPTAMRFPTLLPPLGEGLRAWSTESRVRSTQYRVLSTRYFVLGTLFASLLRLSPETGERRPLRRERPGRYNPSHPSLFRCPQSGEPSHEFQDGSG